MTVFSATSPNNAIRNVETSNVDGEEYALIHTGSSAGAALETLKRASPDAAILSDITADNNEHVIICKTGCSSETLIDALTKGGQQLEEVKEPKAAFDPWFWRGASSVVGQLLQLTSGLTTYNPDKILPDGSQKLSLSGDVGVFAVLNLLANFGNMKFGSQIKEDAHQTRFLKSEVNSRLAHYDINASDLPSPDMSVLSARPPAERTFMEKLYDFGEHNSVTFIEYGLRMAGTAALITPVDQLGDAFSKASQGQFSEAVSAAINKDSKTLTVGLGMMAGKLCGLVAEEPDPYNPAPETLLGALRKYVAFEASSIIESGFTAYMMMDRFNNKRSIIGYDGDMNAPDFNPMMDLNPDAAGALGNLIFLGGYGMRMTASVGSRDVNISEMAAHISDSMQLMKPEDIPNALMETSMMLSAHFAESPQDISFMEIYTHIANDLEKHHNIDVSALHHSNDNMHETSTTTPDERIENVQYHAPVNDKALAHSVH